MRRWRKNNDNDLLKFEDLDESEEDEEVDRYRLPKRRPSFVGKFDDDDDEVDEGEGDDVDDAIATFDKLAPLVRAGEYKPKQSDPYTLHLLYQNLLHLGEL